MLPIVTLLITLTGLLVSCASGDRPLEAVDPNAAPATPTYDDVFGIIYRECVPCHDSDGNGYFLFTQDGKPDGVLYGTAAPGLNTCGEIIDNLSGIEQDILVTNTMPPGAWPRLTEREKLIIKRWIDNGAPAPCN